MILIGLVAAMTQESAALLRHIKKLKISASGPFRAKRFEITDQTCILITSGMGIRRAAEATRRIVEEFKPGLLISFGIAGAIEPDLEIGDVVAAESYCQLEGGIPDPLLPLAALPNAAREAASRALAECGARFFPGTAITTNGTQISGYTAGTLLHPILEMETAGIAQVATERQIPLLSLRAISDGPHAPIPLDLGEVMDQDANLQIGKMIKVLARNPKILLQSGQMMRNSRIAADNAAVALVAALMNGGF